MITASFIIAKAIGLTISWWWILAAFTGDYLLSENLVNKSNIRSDDDY